MNETDNKLTIGTNLHGKDYVYEVVKVLGQGSFGITYLAKVCLKGALGSLQGTIHVAIKEFYMKEMNSRTGTAVDSGKESRMFHSYRDKFRKEALNLSRMDHPGIVKVLEVFDENNTSYIVMEYLTGGTLDATIKEKTKLDEAEAIDTISKIGLALSYMHDQRMLHLDLKPQNVMFDNAKQPVLIDFGLSKHFDESGEPESSTSIGLGTPGYAPIEQVDYESGAEFQPTLDIYALGATLYKSLTGLTPPTASTVLNRPTLLHDKLMQAGVSEDCRNLVLKAMQPLKSARPQSMKEFLSMMESSQQDKNGKDIENEDDESTILPSAKNELKPINVVQDVQPAKELKAEINKDLKEVVQNPLDNGTPAITSLEPDEDESTLLTAPAKSVGKQPAKKVTSENVTISNGEKKVSVSQPTVTEKNQILSEAKKTQVEKDSNKSALASEIVKGQKGVKTDENIKQPVSVVHETKSKSALKQNDKKTVIDDAKKKADSEMDVLSPIGTGPAIDFKNASPVYLDRFGAVVTDISDLEFQNEMAIVQQYGLYGFVNRKNQLVVGCKYDTVESYENGYASVRYHGRYGLIDRSGREVAPCVYEQEVYYSEGLILTSRYGMWGFVNLNGDVVIPYLYEDASYFCNGLAPVKKDNCWGYIDKTGQVVIPFEYQGVDDINDTFGPLYPMLFGFKWGYVNLQNEKVIPFIYDNAGAFIEGLANVQYGAKWGLINEEGKAIVPFNYDHIYFNCNIRKWVVEKDNKKGLLDVQGKVVCKCEYSFMDSFNDGLCSVCKNNKYGFIDADGHEVIPCGYDWSADYFVGGKVMVCKDQTYCIIDKQGQTVRTLDIKWTNNPGFLYCWLIACRKGKTGVMDYKGDVILPFEYQDIQAMHDSYYFKVLQNQKYGLLDEQLNTVAHPMYTYLEDSFSEGLIAAGRNGSSYGFINTKGDDVIPFTYNQLNIPTSGETYLPFKNGIAKIEGKFISRKNQVIEIFKGHRYSKYILDILLLIFFGFWCLVALVCAMNGVNSKREMLFIVVGLSGLVFSIRRLYKDERLIKNRNKYRLVSQVFSNGISNLYNDSAYLVSNGLLAVCRVDNWGFIDKNHHEVIPPRYKWVSLFDEKNECWALQANGENLEVIKVNTKGEERSLTYEEKVEWETNWKF